jgi:hypothetical protein
MPHIGPALFSAVYFATAWLVWRTANAVVDSGESVLWNMISASLVVLAFNKLFESAITEFVRVYAVEHGWYSERRVVQVEFIVVVMMTCLLAAGVALFLARHAPVATQLASIGIVLLIALALVRDASLHEIDYLISQWVFGLKLNWILELGGLVLVLLANEWRGVSILP